jgi:hypothetical protein
LRESLEAQKLFGKILWRQANPWIFDQADFGDLWWRLGRNRAWNPEQSCSAKHRSARQKFSAAESVFR